LKPTPGRIPATGHYPPSAGPFSLLGVVGPMARTIVDLKLLFEGTQGGGFGDPPAAPVPVLWPKWAWREGRSGRSENAPRIGYFEDDGRTPVTSEIRAAIRKAAECLRHAGFEVEPFRPEGLEKVRELWWKLFGIAGGMLLEPLTRGHNDDLSPILKE